MASLTGPTSSLAPDQPDPGRDGVTIALARPQDHAQAISLLLTGRSVPAQRGAAALETARQVTRDPQLGIEHLWVARRGDHVLFSALLAHCAGKTALIFLSPNVNRRDFASAVELVRAASNSQDRRRARLVQALLDPQQEPIAQVLAEAGYQRLAWLVYMRRPAADIQRKRGAVEPTDPALPAGVTGVHYQPTTRPLFARAILESYRDTLDCPGLLGIRDIDDIIDGHMATGRFVPDLWLALHHGDQPVGVMLLNIVPHRDALELVYLGLAPEWRRKGLAQTLLRRGLELARKQGLADMILAVDQDNAPAIKLYRAMRFTPTTRKLAMIYSPPEK